MKVPLFSAKPYDKTFFQAAQHATEIQFEYLEAKLTAQTATLVDGQPTICCFVNDCLDSQVLNILHTKGVRHIALRCAGFNNVDLAAAKTLGITVSRVPAYSPHAVAEHAVGPTDERLPRQEKEGEEV